jgi:cation efflux family protein
MIRSQEARGTGPVDRASPFKTIVWVELIADVLVAIVKLFAAFCTGSASTAAEGVHSVVDVGSGGLMLYGYQRSQRGPDRRHPHGHGRELYFWSCVRTPQIEEAVRSLESRIRDKHPQVVALFVKPQSHAGFNKAARDRPHRRIREC